MGKYRKSLKGGNGAEFPKRKMLTGGSLGRHSYSFSQECANTRNEKKNKEKKKRTGNIYTDLLDR